MDYLIYLILSSFISIGNPSETKSFSSKSTNCNEIEYGSWIDCERLVEVTNTCTGDTYTYTERDKRCTELVTPIGKY